MPPETFEQFMQRCLHDPQRGYYARNIRSIGARGDFTTSPQLSEAPAKAIARWAARAMMTSKTCNLIEVGPGLGTLSKQVIHHLPLLRRLRTRLHLVESSPALRKQQRNSLGERVQIHADMFSALDACSGHAVIFSNELVDAFPVRLFEKCDAQWREVALDHSSGTTREILMESASLPESSIFQRPLPNHQRVEVHASYHQWLESWLPHWKYGEILTIDYGDSAEKIYHRKPKGSLRGYLLHQRTEGSEIYQNQGLQDLTADVNFTDLIQWSQPWLNHEHTFNLADFISPFCHQSESHLISACEYFTCLHQSRKRPATESHLHHAS